MENAFEGSGIDYTIEVAPVPPNTDFTPFVRAMSDFGAEMIIATGHPPGNAAIVSLSADLAGNVPITGAWTPPDLAVGGLQDLAIGRFSDFACADYLSAYTPIWPSAIWHSPTTSLCRTMQLQGMRLCRLSRGGRRGGR